MAEFDTAMREARRQILAELRRSRSEQTEPRPTDVIYKLAPKHDREPYRAALSSLVHEGAVRLTDDWCLRLGTPGAT